MPGQHMESDGRIWGAEPRAAIFLPLFLAERVIGGARADDARALAFWWDAAKPFTGA